MSHICSSASARHPCYSVLVWLSISLLPTLPGRQWLALCWSLRALAAPQRMESLPGRQGVAQHRSAGKAASPGVPPGGSLLCWWSSGGYLYWCVSTQPISMATTLLLSWSPKSPLGSGNDGSFPFVLHVDWDWACCCLYPIYRLSETPLSVSTYNLALP